MRGPSPVVASGGHSSSCCAGLSLLWPLFAEHGSGHAGSVVVAHGLGCSAACGIFPDQGLNPCPLHQQADSQPLRHQGSPLSKSFIVSGLTFRSLIHYEFVFVCGVRECSNFIVLNVAVQFSQNHLLKRLSFLHCISLPPLS